MKPIRLTDEQMTTLRHEIARLMGEGWSHTPDEDHCWHNTMIHGPQGVVITIGTSSSHDGKVVIQGWSENFGETPSYNSAHAIMPTIRVSYARGAATIHKEMTRRFLPDFWKALAAADKYIAERDQYRNDSSKTFDAIFAVFTLAKGKPRHDRNEDGGGMIHFGNVGEGYGDIRINSANSVEFSIKSLSRDRAIKLAGFLAAL